MRLQAAWYDNQNHLHFACLINTEMYIKKYDYIMPRISVPRPGTNRIPCETRRFVYIQSERVCRPQQRENRVVTLLPHSNQHTAWTANGRSDSRAETRPNSTKESLSTTNEAGKVRYAAINSLLSSLVLDVPATECAQQSHQAVQQTATHACQP